MPGGRRNLKWGKLSVAEKKVLLDMGVILTGMSFPAEDVFSKMTAACKLTGALYFIDYAESSNKSPPPSLPCILG